MAKSTSCGVIVTDNNRILICLPTNNVKWDIPKGKQEAGEEYIQTAIRETFEETSIKIDEKNLIDLGRFEYKLTKDLYLFKYVPESMPNVTDLICISHFTDEYGTHPEMSKFAIVDIAKSIKMVNNSLAKIISKIFEENA